LGVLQKLSRDDDDNDVSIITDYLVQILQDDDAYNDLDGLIAMLQSFLTQGMDDDDDDDEEDDKKAAQLAARIVKSLAPTRERQTQLEGNIEDNKNSLKGGSSCPLPQLHASLPALISINSKAPQ
jgi:hypothetical protein